MTEVPKRHLVIVGAGLAAAFASGLVVGLAVHTRDDSGPPAIAHRPTPIVSGSATLPPAGPTATYPPSPYTGIDPSDRVKLPDFKGDNTATVEEWLVYHGWEKYGAGTIVLRGASGDDTFIEWLERWWVVSQSPEPGTKVRPNRKVVLKVQDEPVDTGDNW